MQENDTKTNADELRYCRAQFAGYRDIYHALLQECFSEGRQKQNESLRSFVSRWLKTKLFKQDIAEYDRREWAKTHVLKAPYKPEHSQNPDQAIDVILPVYNGYNFLAKLFDGIPKTTAPYRIIVIDDMSTDERIFPFLEGIASRDDRICVYRNEVNLGFIKTVNRGFSLIQNHCVILNTDIELPEFWLERLIRPILSDDMIASATPFSNSASMVSFPVFWKDNPLPAGYSPLVMDMLFRNLRPVYNVLPTGVGFCMAINKKAIDAIGVFDADTFGKGYGEEVDWCRRAVQKGFRNVLVENLFVYHKHGGSFSGAERSALQKVSRRTLTLLHPDYSPFLDRYRYEDPTRMYREWVLNKMGVRQNFGQND